MAGLVCRKKLRERHNGDGMEAAAADSVTVTSSVQSVQASSANSQTDNQPGVCLADSVVDSSHASLSVVTNQPEGQQLDRVTEQLADLELSGGLRQRRHNRERRDVQDTVLGDDRH